MSGLSYAETIEFVCASIKAGRTPLVLGPPGVGKCLGLGTPVMKYDGSVVPVESIVVGDALMGPDSKPRTVLSTATGTGQLFKITPTKGDSWVCNDVHVLTLVHTATNVVRDVSLDALLQEPKYSQGRWKQFRVGVDFRSRETFVDPYFFGVWVGDGTKCLRDNGKLRGIAISKPDAEILSVCQAISDKYDLVVHSRLHNNCPTHNLVKDSGTNAPNVLLEMFRSKLGSTLEIPKEFLVNDRETRLQFLAGLLDTDGHLQTENSCFEISQKRKDYAEDILFLARSLGFAAYCKPKVVDGVVHYRTHISGDVSAIPTRIHRKQANVRRQIKNVLRTGFTAEPIGEGEFFGFTLDKDGRFLLGDFTVTHNTQMTHVIYQRMRDAFAGMCMFNANDWSPEELGGIPAPIAGRDEFRRLTDSSSPLFAACHAPYLIFCDEFGTCEQSMFKQVRRMMHDRRIGSHELHPSTRFVCFSNPQNMSLEGRDYPLPVLNALNIVHLDYKLDDFRGWLSDFAAEHDGPMRTRALELLGLLETRPDLLETDPSKIGSNEVQSYVDQIAARNENWASPRSWEGFLRTIVQLDATNMSKEARAHVVTGILGPRVAKVYGQLTSARRALPKIPDLDASPLTAAMPTNAIEAMSLGPALMFCQINSAWAYLARLSCLANGDEIVAAVMPVLARRDEPILDGKPWYREASVAKNALVTQYRDAVKKAKASDR